MSNLIKQGYFRTKAVEYLQRWIGTPYSWGGDDFSSFDCSGLIVEVLSAVGIIQRGKDYTAEGLRKKFKDNYIPKPYAGCLVFFVNWEGQAKHVAMCLDEYFIIHASGGRQNTITIQNAIKHNAYIKQDFLPDEEKKRKAYKPVYIDPFLGVI